MKSLSMVEPFIFQISIEGLIVLGAASAAGLYFHIGWLQREVTTHQRYIMDYLGSVSEFAFPSWEGSGRVGRGSERTRMENHIKNAYAIRVYFVDRMLDYFGRVKKDCLDRLQEAERKDLRNLLEDTFYKRIRDENREKYREYEILEELHDEKLYRDESICIFEKLIRYLPNDVGKDFKDSREVIIKRIRQICYDAELQVKELDKGLEIHKKLNEQLRCYTSYWLIGPFLSILAGIIFISLMPSNVASEYHGISLLIATLGPLAYMGIYLGSAIEFIKDRDKDTVLRKLACSGSRMLRWRIR